MALAAPVEAVQAAATGRASRASPVAETLLAIAETVDCARLRVDYAESAARVVVRGHVPSEAARRSLLEDMQDAVGSATVASDDLQVIGAPFCRVLDVLDRPGIARSIERRDGVEAFGDTLQAGVLSYMESDPMELSFAAPDFESYLYIDYFKKDGEVVHMQSHGDRLGVPFAPGARLRIGGEGGASPTIYVSSPSARELILVVASSVRLYDDDRPIVEDAGPYLTALDRGMSAAEAAGASVAYAYQVVYTRPRSE